MAQATSIEWTDVSWNPTHGCSKVSAGCNHCYAETLSLRYRQTLKPWTARNAAENVLLKPHKLREPLSNAGPWKNPCRVFVNSMSDLFHEQIPDEYIDQVFAVMAVAERHTFQVLTKRPERMRDYLSHADVVNRIENAMCGLCCSHGVGSGFCGYPGDDCGLWGCTWPLSNVWAGVSIESRKWVGRADVLRETPAAVRFISAEPLLGPLWGGRHYRNGEYEDIAGLDLTSIDWLIVGGESGSGHRHFDLEWARDLRDTCMAQRDVRETCGGFGAFDALHGGPAHMDGPTRPCPRRHTAYFLKQTGGSRPGTKLEDLPEDLRIREFPVPRP